MFTVGIDAVSIKRLERWQHRSDKTLQRIYTTEEIRYSKSNPLKAAERFAARFAAKEAAFKCISPLLPQKLPFLTCCRHIAVLNRLSGAPLLYINWSKLEIPNYQTSLSITHTNSTAIAIVLLY